MATSPTCPTKRPARQSNLELLRILSMLLIVLHHFACYGHGAWVTRHWQIDILQFGGGVGVTLFVLISGYFMVESRFSGKKFMRLWVQVSSINLALYLLFKYIISVGVEPLGGILSLSTLLCPLLSGQYWFVTTYTLLMLMSPVMNMVLHRASRQQVRWVIIVLAAFASISPSLPYFSDSAYAGALAYFAMLYFMAGYQRMYGKELNGTIVRNLAAFVLIMVASNAIMAATCGADSIGEQKVHMAFATKFSIPNLLMAVFLFRAFLGMNLGSSKWINGIAACTLGVYLIHDNCYVRQYIWDSLFHCKTVSCMGWPFWWHCITTVLAVYIGCTILAFIWKQTVERAYITWVDPRLLPLLRRTGGYAAGGLDKFCKRYIDRD